KSRNQIVLGDIYGKSSIWLRYQSRTGYHNKYKEYRDTTLWRFSMHPDHQNCHYPFHKRDIKFSLVFQKVRPPTRRLKTTYKETRPNLFK
ncbi:hypothetical protein MKX03_029772, partial [Papaver bracteatum]